MSRADLAFVAFAAHVVNVVLNGLLMELTPHPIIFLVLASVIGASITQTVERRR